MITFKSKQNKFEIDFKKTYVVKGNILLKVLNTFV